MADDSEHDPHAQTVQHIMDHQRAPTEKKHKTALKHLQRYIDSHYDRHPGILDKNMKANNLPYAVISNEDFVGFYLDWLARHATHLDNKDKLLSHSSVAGYASSFGEYYINKYRNR